MRNLVLPVVLGFLFAFGLALAGMTLPQRVVGFLDFSGEWDPTLAFVMGGAVGSFAVLYRLILRSSTNRSAPVAVPLSTPIDARLVVGSAVFGVGWGLSGYCPGPGVIAAGTGSVHGIVFVVGMVLGMLLYHASQRKAARARGHETEGLQEAT